MLAEDQRETDDCCIYFMLAEKKYRDLVSAHGPSSLAGLMNRESRWRIRQDKHLQKIRVTCFKENKIFSIRKVTIRMRLHVNCILEN